MKLNQEQLDRIAVAAEKSQQFIAAITETIESAEVNVEEEIESFSSPGLISIKEEPNVVLQKTNDFIEKLKQEQLNP